MPMLLRTLAFAIATTAVAFLPGAPTSVTTCAPPDSAEALLRDLKVIAAQYHPDAITPDKAHQFQVVALIVDRDCRLLRHTAFRRVGDRLTVDSTMKALFPDANLKHFLIGGIAEFGPKEFRSASSPWLVWMMVEKQLWPNYRMKLTRLGHRFARGTDNQTVACSLARARLGLQLMRGRQTAPTHDP